MHVSVETTQGLGRRMTVQVPADQVDQEIDSRLKSLAESVRLDGFRPGKVPLRVVKQRFGRQVEQEVASELINSSFQEALTQENLKPAGGPQFEPKPLKLGEGLEYTAEFEVMPEFEPADMSDIELEKPVAEVQDADIDAMLEKLRQQRATWETVDREAKEGDQVTIDFQGSIDGEVFEGGSGENMPIELGSGRMIAGFEEGLVGAKAGEERVLDLTFPEDYHKQDLAGKPVQFKVTIKSVAEAKLPELDEDFVKTLGVQDGNLDSLKAEVRKNMERELDNAIKAVTKQRAFNAMLEKNQVEVPASMVNEEVERLANEMYQSMGGNSQGINLPRDIFKEKAERRVSLGLIINEIYRHNNMTVDQQKMMDMVDSIAQSYENPDEVKQYYLQNQEAMASVQSLVLEEQIVDWLLDQAKTSEKTYSFDELIELRQAAND